MQIELSKKSGGVVVLRCVRDNGTVTWQKNEGHMAQFFVHHDLTHYAVETLLCLRFAFYGIVADGWNIADFGSPWPKGQFHHEWLPDATLGEGLVGLLDAERAGTLSLDAALANSHLADVFTEGCLPPPPLLTDALLDAIRARRDEFFAAFYTLKTGETLTLAFPITLEV